MVENPIHTLGLLIDGALTAMLTIFWLGSLPLLIMPPLEAVVVFGVFTIVWAIIISQSMFKESISRTRWFIQFLLPTLILAFSVFVLVIYAWLFQGFISDYANLFALLGYSLILSRVSAIVIYKLKTHRFPKLMYDKNNKKFHLDKVMKSENTNFRDRISGHEAWKGWVDLFSARTTRTKTTAEGEHATQPHLAPTEVRTSVLLFFYFLFGS